jgi:hypothetical protein
MDGPSHKFARSEFGHAQHARRTLHREVQRQSTTRHADFQTAALPENNLVSTIIQILFPGFFALMDLFFCPVRH